MWNIIIFLQTAKLEMPQFMGGTLTTSNSLRFKNIYFSNPNLGGGKRMTCSTSYTHSLFFIGCPWIPGVFIFRRFSLITGTGGWMAGRQRVTMYFNDVMKWKSLCLIVLKMRTDPCLGCICLVAGKWAVRELFSRLVAPASAGKWENDLRAFGCSMSIWSTSCTYTC